jgi:hypothetical protein
VSTAESRSTPPALAGLLEDDESAVHVAWPVPDPPDDSVVGTPDRRAGSLRRTAHINMVWPAGRGTPTHLRGAARDLLTSADGKAEVVAEASMVVVVGDGRTVNAVETVPEHAGIGRLVGAVGGSNFRAAIDAAIPGERDAATPLYFLLDDIAGASLIAGFAWSQSKEGQWMQGPPPRQPGGSGPRLRKGRIICSGLRPDGFAAARHEVGDFGGHFLRLAGDLSTDDALGWHDIEPAPEVCMRRRRRVDVWRDGSLLVVDAHFRDSLWRHDGVELALHEYTVDARLDAATRTIEAIHAQPRVLPFPECPMAAPHVEALVGMQVGGFRTSVQDTLTELEACTHLNDMLRCLAEVASLAARLD